MTRIGRRLGLVAAASVMALAVPSMAGAAASSAALVLRGTHYCISVEDGTALAANPVDLAACDGAGSEQFIVEQHSLVYAKTVHDAIPLCIGNERALGKAVLLNCASHNAQVRAVALQGGAQGFSLTGGFLSGPALGQLRIQNSPHINGREAFLQRR